MGDDELVVLEQKRIQAVFAGAFHAETILEVFLEDQGVPYFSSLIDESDPDPAPEEEPPGEEATPLRITPLEPPMGNALIHRSQRVRLRFALEDHLLEAVVPFRRILPMGDRRALELGFPSFLKRVIRRDPPRRLLPREERMGITVTQRGVGTARAQLLEINERGLSFQCRSMMIPFHEDERVKIEFNLEDSPQKELFFFGEISQHFRFRIPSRSLDPQAHVAERYGVRFSGLTHPQSALVLQLNRGVDPECQSLAANEAEEGTAEEMTS
ncbi:MAG: hypothetical protein HQL51_11740 [Magnetococcales bacterium]|nr:hypothetical protein [Magnetococcales bacterium]